MTFFIVQKTANYAEIGMVGKLEAGFQQVLLSFLRFSQYCCEILIVKNEQRKVKNTCLYKIAKKKKKKKNISKNCIGQANVCSEFNFRVNVKEQNTEIAKTSVF